MRAGKVVIWKRTDPPKYAATTRATKLNSWPLGETRLGTIVYETPQIKNTKKVRGQIMKNAYCTKSDIETYRLIRKTCCEQSLCTLEIEGMGIFFAILMVPMMDPLQAGGIFHKKLSSGTWKTQAHFINF